MEFTKMCSNENIFVFPLANRLFLGYVSSGRWVGEVSQTRYARKGNKPLFALCFNIIWRFITLVTTR